MPSVLADYAKYKHRVTFLGIDYGDNRTAGDAMIAKYGISFPVERSEPNMDAPSPARGDEPLDHSSTVIHGLTPKTLPIVLPLLKTKIPSAMYANLEEIAGRCRDLSEANCITYAKVHHVVLNTSASVNGLSSAPTTSEESFVLPHLFIIDANGVLRSSIQGYEPGKDAIKSELAKLNVGT